jgi:hypothetical protein
MVGAKGLGDEARQAKWTAKGHSRRRAQACGYSAPDMDRRNRIQLVEEGGCSVTSNNEIKGFPQHGGKRCPCRDDGGGEIARFFASSPIRETALATLIHQRRLTPSCGGQASTAERTVGPARIIAESLTRKPGIREQNRHLCDVARSRVTSAFGGKADPSECSGCANSVGLKVAPSRWRKART